MSRATELRRPATGRQVGQQIVRLVLAAVLIWLVFVGIGWLLSHRLQHSGLVRWDGSVDRWLAHRRHAGWNTVTHLATFGAETITVIAIGLVAFGLLRWRLGRWTEPIFLAVSVIGEVCIFVSTTLLVDRHRPSVPRLDSAPPTSSFPSGHTAASVALYGSLAVIAWHAARAGWLRTVATVLAVLMPLAVAGSRLYRGMHYPTDVLAGALLSICWLTVTSRLLLPSRPSRTAR
ncbi:MAG: phosphatase PAP2 family protein [Jatrophihabitantaceae bacterium]